MKIRHLLLVLALALLSCEHAPRQYPIVCPCLPMCGTSYLPMWTVYYCLDEPLDYAPDLEFATHLDCLAHMEAGYWCSVPIVCNCDCYGTVDDVEGCD